MLTKQAILKHESKNGRNVELRRQYNKNLLAGGICWEGCRRVPNTKPYTKGSCVCGPRRRKKSKKKKKKRSRKKKKLSAGSSCSKGSKKSAKLVYDPQKKKKVCVRYGDPNLSIKKNLPNRKRSFCARHQCHKKLKGNPATAGYQSCKAWNCPRTKMSGGKKKRKKKI